MTSFHGGKQRIGKQLSEVIVKKSIDISEKDKFEIKGYCEPFCGMLGVYQHIPEFFNNPDLVYKAGDINKSVIMMWQDNKLPSSTITTQEEFMKLKYDGETSAHKGFVGHFYGYSGQYFQPFKNRESTTLKNTITKIEQIKKKVHNVSFSSGSYTQYSTLKNYVIYCDPPYQVQSNYYDENRKRLSFDHDKFWDWCRFMSIDNIVFVSEYNLPEDFEKIYSIASRTGGSPKVDNLYMLN